jgi:hypothetical protein
MSEGKKFFGKYRGTVLNNVDPMSMGRIQVIVPDVSNVLPSTWALPCVPIAGPQMGMIAVPPPLSLVWVEFEQGDPDYPIWVGGFWGQALELPALSKLAMPPIPAITLQTLALNGIQVSDLPGPTGGIVLKSTLNAAIIVNDTGIYISNGKGPMISMVGPAIDISASTVTINKGALVVT